MRNKVEILLNGIMSKAWMTGSIEKATEVLDEVCREADQPGLSAEDRSARCCIRENINYVRAAIRRVSLRDEKFRAHHGVGYVIERIFDGSTAPLHRSSATTL